MGKGQKPVFSYNDEACQTLGLSHMGVVCSNRSACAIAQVSCPLFLVS
jgi:hypothetical protein